jgi:hypothetical protein
MNRPRRNRYRTGGLLLIAVGLLAAVGAMAGFAVAKDGNHRAEKRHHHGRHHHRHGAPAGTIQSFDSSTGVLTISLDKGGTVSGVVDRGTKIKCEDENSPDITQFSKGEPEPGDDNGGQGNEPGDDNGGQGNEPGDDNGGGNSGPGSSKAGGGPSGNDDNGTGANCTVSDLIPGTVVERAELDLVDGTAFFDEVELND